MPGIIAWETHSGEEVERAIATFICLQNPRASRIRPSVGDGGMDVLVSNADGTKDIFQIKKYASNLSPNQRKDIEKSFDRMLEYTDKVGYQVREWRLVMPLDQTKENQIWFEGFTNGKGFDCFWDGRSRVDGWAAMMPQVGDYYFEGGNERVRSLINESLSAARLSDATSWPEMKQSIRAKQRLLDELDPHYSYSFHSFSGFEVAEPQLVVRPGLVMTTVEGKEGVGWIVMDVIAKHSASSQLAPVRGTVTFMPRNQRETNALRAFLDYGIPLPKMRGCISDTLPSLLAGEEMGAKDCSVWTFHSPGEEYCGPEIIRLRSRSGSRLEVCRRDSSAGGKGEYWEGRDGSGLVSMRYRLDYASAELRMGMFLTGESDDSADVDDALASVRCLYEAARDDAVLFVGRDEDAFEVAFGELGLDASKVESLYTLLSSLAAFNARSFRSIPLTSILELKRGEVEAIRKTVEFCDGGPWLSTYEQVPCTFVGDGAEVGETCLVLAAQPLVCVIQGERYRLGQYVSVFVGTRKATEGDETAVFVPNTEFGDDVLSFYPKDQPSLRVESHIVTCDPPAKEEWLTAVREAAESRSLSQWLEGACGSLLDQLEENCA